MTNAARPSRTVAALSSLVMRGAVGLRASQFALERRGHTVWPVPTVLLPWHPGQGPSTRTLNSDFAAHTADLSTQAAALDAVFTGYFGAAHQVTAAASFIDAVRQTQPSAIILVDPVIGDEHGRYVPDEVADAIKTELLPRADIITPNAFELFDLTGERDPEAAAAQTGVATVVATSSATTQDRIAATLWRGAMHHTVWHRASHPAPRGTGDLFAAIFLAAILEGQPAPSALAEAAAATSAVAAASPSDALALQAAQSAIAGAPKSLVTTDGGPIVHGVDGCPGGYAVVTLGDGPPRASVIPTIAPLFARGETVAIDIPIGLPASISGPGRPPEQAIRPLLGPRRNSVFPIPCRDAVFEPTYSEACAIARAASTPPKAMSIQAFNLFPKIREVDAALTPATEAHVFEAHAELAFWRLNGERPMADPKAASGVPATQQLASRIALLTAHGLPSALFENRPAGLPLVDLVDAAAIALVAQRCAAGTAEPFPDPPSRDARGLRMAIWA